MLIDERLGGLDGEGFGADRAMRKGISSGASPTPQLAHQYESFSKITSVVAPWPNSRGASIAGPREVLYPWDL